MVCQKSGTFYELFGKLDGRFGFVPVLKMKVAQKKGLVYEGNWAKTGGCVIVPLLFKKLSQNVK